MGRDVLICVTDILLNAAEEVQKEEKEEGRIITDIYSVKKKRGPFVTEKKMGPLVSKKGAHGSSLFWLAVFVVFSFPPLPFSTS